MVNEKLANVQKSDERIQKLESLKNELSRYARERHESINAEENGIAKKRKIEKKLQNLVDTKSRPKQKRRCQNDVKIVDFFRKRKQIEE